jgi:hypothetical protein
MINFLHNLALFWVKNAIFAKKFGENILKTITSVPDWAKIRPRGDSSLLTMC